MLKFGEALGERLKEERLRLGLNQAELAAVGGVAKTSQFNYEKGERSPDAAYLAAVAVAGVDVLYVVTGTRTPAAASSLSDVENILVQRYRTMPPENRATVDRVAEAMAVYLPADVRG